MSEDGQRRPMTAYVGSNSIKPEGTEGPDGLTRRVVSRFWHAIPLRPGWYWIRVVRPNGKAGSVAGPTQVKRGWWHRKEVLMSMNSNGQWRPLDHFEHRQWWGPLPRPVEGT